MNSSIRKWNFLSTIFGLILFTVFLPPVSVSARVDNQHEKSTPYFNISTDISQEFTDLIAKHMDALYQEFLEKFSEYSLAPPSEATVRVFKRKHDYESAVPPPLRNTTGSFIAEDLLLMSFLGNRSREEVLRTLYHESFHLFLYDRIGTNIPLWLNEGFAEYFSEALWQGDEFRTGQIPLERINLLQTSLRQNTLIPFTRLLRLNNPQWMANTQAHAQLGRLQYSQSWSLIHFLLHAENGRYKRRLAGFLRARQAGKSTQEAFMDNFGKDINAMEKAWRKYVMNLRPDSLSICRHRMSLLLSFSDILFDDLTDLNNIDKLTDKLLKQPDEKWHFDDPYGSLITSDDIGELKNILQCPECEQNEETSYTLKNDPETGLPKLYCRGHDGITIKAYMLRRDARWQPETEILMDEFFE